MQFIPDAVHQPILDVPFFEDSSQKAGIAGHGTRKSIEQLKSEVRDAFARLGAGVIAFRQGTFYAEHDRYGYRILFVLGSARGRVDVLALPIRNETPRRKEDALKQVLYNVRDTLQSEYLMLLHAPGSHPLVPHLLGPGGRTVAEYMMERGELPALTDDEVVEGEFRSE